MSSKVFEERRMRRRSRPQVWTEAERIAHRVSLASPGPCAWQGTELCSPTLPCARGCLPDVWAASH